MMDSKFTSSAEWKRIRKAYLATQPQPYTCTQCGRTDLAGMSLQVDHIIPGKQRDGTWSYDNSFDNLQILCDICNGRKRDKVTIGKHRVEWQSNRWY